MKKRIKRLWIKALRSGTYAQAYQALRVKDKFCCLGVLCDLHARETGKRWKSLAGGTHAYAGESCTLPAVVFEWAGLTDDDPKLGRSHNSVIRAAALNDRGVNFNRIADRIEKHL